MIPTTNESGTNSGEYTSEVGYISSNPNKQLGFEISPTDASWSFTPEFYPDDFTQMKKKELSRYGGNCGGESVSIKSIKNREFHATGVLLEGELNIFHGLMDFNGEVDLISPVAPNGGMECFIKKAELGGQSGWDPHSRQWMFEYTLDFVSTGRDEHNSDKNDIVTALIDNTPEGSYPGDHNGPAFGL